MAKRVFWTVLFGLLATGIAVAANQIGTPIGSGKPSCSSAYRGLTWVTPGDAGVADVFELCQKYADGGFAWADVTNPAGGGEGNSKAYANYTYVGSSAQTISQSFVALDINTTVTSSNITRSGNSITFGRAGAYLISVNVHLMDPNSAGISSAYRLRNVTDGVTIATSNSFGLSPWVSLAETEDSLQFSATFLAVVTDATKTYEVQMGRSFESEAVIKAPSGTIGGDSAPTKSITIVSVD